MNLSDSPLSTSQENRIVLVIALVQFLNVLDFMMVMPLGPDLSRAIGISVDHIGIISGSYTLAAAVAGFIGSFFLDRYQRRFLFLILLLGLTVSTTLAALAQTKEFLIFARVLAGLFGGPLSSVALAIISDVVPPSRRGQAMGKVMGSFSIASILGVPFGLELASRLSWKAPFIFFGLLGSIVLGLAFVFLKLPTRSIRFMNAKSQFSQLYHFLSKEKYFLAFLTTGLSMFSGFILIPNISAHLQINYHYPREQLGILYMVGGVFSFMGMILTGKWIDKTSSFFTTSLSVLLIFIPILLGFYFQIQSIPVLLIFVLFMVSMSARSVSLQTLASKVASPNERASFMSLTNAVTHLFGGLSSVASSFILHESAVKLEGMDKLALIALGCAVMIPFMVRRVERNLRVEGLKT